MSWWLDPSSLEYCYTSSLLLRNKKHAQQEIKYDGLINKPYGRGREISDVEISWLAALSSDVTDDSGDASTASSPPPLQRSTHGLAAGTTRAPRPEAQNICLRADSRRGVM